MRKWISLCESVLYMGLPEENPAERIEFEGFSFERQSQPQSIGTAWYVIHPELMAMQCFVVDMPMGGTTMSVHAEADPMASYCDSVYRFICWLADREGRTLVPSYHNTALGKKFWTDNGHVFG